jgi:hypothetical protein
LQAADKLVLLPLLALLNAGPAEDKKPILRIERDVSQFPELALALAEPANLQLAALSERAKCRTSARSDQGHGRD